MQQRKLLSPEFVAANLPVLLELGQKHFNPVAYQLAVGALFANSENLNLGFPGVSSNPPLLYYFSLSLQGRYIIFNQPGLYAAISDDTLNYQHIDGSSIIGNFSIEKRAQDFFRHRNIAERIDPALLIKNRKHLYHYCKPLFLQNSPLALALQPRSYFAEFTLADLYDDIDSMVGHSNDYTLKQLLSEYRELRDALYRPSPSDQHAYYISLVRLRERHDWLRQLLDADIKAQKELEAMKEKEERATKPPEPGILDKIGKFFGPKETTTEKTQLLKPINEF